ncbi:hypothetical protein SR1949_44330 [Sphaerospermopsis reniformis]|uniref:Glycosyltransferase RgtA/B/C/D-like domain-containing protein n=1 Tax=Sphaerospermopsis reniformis TaxID=531300 RepID=A0A480A7R5_9CYAN|nr:hypothetical protein [Sphaerospermopsis reniformis]GCL39308.1 hypothetical protein SR1949_44330 [Sphaerospermopsis reniformis]
MQLIHTFKQNKIDFNPIILFTTCFIILFLRRIDAFLNPQFWAEDGTIFYSQAYNLGVLKSLFVPHAGYLHTLPRLVAGISQLIPLHYAPLLFNLVAITFQIIPVLLFCSKRFETILPSVKLRLLISAIYLALPNCFEIHSNLTNTHWYLTFLCFLVIIAPVSNTKFYFLFDIMIFLITGLSTISSVMILPFVLGNYYLVGKNKTRKICLLISLLTSIIQLSVLFSTSSRLSHNLFSSRNLDFLAKVLSNNVFLPSLIGLNRTSYLLKFLGGDLNDIPWNFIVYIIFTLSMMWLIYCLINSPQEIKMLILFSSVMTSITLLSMKSWELSIPPGNANRYYMFSTITFIITWIWGLCQKQYWIKCVSFVIISTVIFVGITGDFTHNPYTDFKFSYYAKEFEKISAGTTYKIPINPTWEMTLIKR